MSTLVIEQTQILFFGKKLPERISVEIDVRTAIHDFTYRKIFSSIFADFSGFSAGLRRRFGHVRFVWIFSARGNHAVYAGNSHGCPGKTVRSVFSGHSVRAAGGFRDRFERCSCVRAITPCASPAIISRLLSSYSELRVSLVPCTGASYQLRNYCNYRYCYCACV